MEQTAVQLLRQRLLNDQQNLPIYNQYINGVIDYIDNQLLEIEKEKIVDAYAEGMGHYGDANSTSDGEQYFNQNFKNK